MIGKTLEHYGADLHRVPEHGWRSMKCPFHDDRHASARVNLEKNGFACLACGVKGDAIKLIREREGLDFDGAKQFAADTIGASVEGVQRTAKQDRPRVRSKWRSKLFQEP